MGLEDPFANTRRASASAMGMLGEHAVSEVPQLTKSLEDEDASVRLAAASALGKLGEDAVSAVPQLVQYLEHEKADVRGAATKALGKLGAHAVSAVPQLMEYLERKSAGLFYFCLNPFSDDTGGLLKKDFRTPETTKLKLLSVARSTSKVREAAEMLPASATATNSFRRSLLGIRTSRQAPCVTATQGLCPS